MSNRDDGGSGSGPGDAKRISTSQRLVAALIQANAPTTMIKAAEANYYDDFRGPLEQPTVQFVADLSAAGLDELASRAMEGEFDATDWEAEQWMTGTPEGRAVIAEFFGPPQAEPPRRKPVTKRGKQRRQWKARKGG